MNVVKKKKKLFQKPFWNTRERWQTIPHSLWHRITENEVFCIYFSTQVGNFFLPLFQIKVIYFCSITEFQMDLESLHFECCKYLVIS